MVADVFSMDLARFTNDSADIEVAMECLRCARCIGLVISRGDFESILSAAVVLKRSEVRACLPAWQRALWLQGSVMDTDMPVHSWR